MGWYAGTVLLMPITVLGPRVPAGKSNSHELLDTFLVTPAPVHPGAGWAGGAGANAPD